MMILDTFISGLGIIIFMAIIVVAIFVLGWIKKDTNGVDKKMDGYEDVKPNICQILFSLENNSDEELWIDLLRMDRNDNRYVFNTSDGNYPMLVEYLKTFSFNVIKTSVNYQHENWQSDVIYNYTYTPFGLSNKSVFVGFHDFKVHQEHRNFIETTSNFDFNFFNTMMVRLAPKETKAITLDVSDQPIEQTEDYKEVCAPPKCALLLKNLSDETQVVKLFDNEYFSQIENKGVVDIQSVFAQVSYIEVLKHFNGTPLTASRINLFIGADNADSTYKLNFDEEELLNHISDDQEQSEKVLIDLGEELFVALFEIELKPKTEMYISFK